MIITREKAHILIKHRQVKLDSHHETPQYQSKTAKLVYAPRKQEKSLTKIKKIRKITIILALSG